MTTGAADRERAGFLWRYRTILLSARVFRLLLLPITSADPQCRRLLAIIQGLATGLGNKAVGILTSFFVCAAHHSFPLRNRSPPVLRVCAPSR
jgi:hypothetical protein